MHDSLSEREKSEREREETLELLSTLIIMASLLKTSSEEKLRLADRQCSPFPPKKKCSLQKQT
jgi:hypothetical protein